MRFKNVKKLFNEVLISGIILSLFAITACGGGGGGGGDDGGDDVSYTPATESDTYSSSDEIYRVETTGDTELTYSIDLGSNTKTVYYIFTNTNLTAETTSPSYISSIINNENEEFSLQRPQFSESSASGSPFRPLLRGKPEITEYNSNPWKYEGTEKQTDSKGSLSIESNSKGPLKASVEDENSFMNESTSDTIPATCKKVVSDGTKTLNIWVANNCWSETGTGKTYYVTQAMVDAMADKFLLAGSNNDVYDWVTNIYGAEWGSHLYTELITAATADNNIHILLYDIDNDNSTTGGVLGFFWAKDNFKKTGTNGIAYSNEKIMFYIDAVMYATPDGTWGITDSMPSEIISTLAHEFQHMIHFYQKSVVDGVSDSDTWLNEMCSLVTEDLLADKLQVNGPRGVTYSNSGAGSSLNTAGRLPLFNYWNDAPLPVWLSGSNAIISYSVSYAFGAYLSRNYGGAALFQDIVKGVTGQSVYGDYRDVVEAVKAHGGASGITMSDIMRDWGAAVVLSSNTSISSSGKFKYNNGSSFMTSTIGTITYNLGSINLYNYRYQYGSSSYLYEPWSYSFTGLNNYDSSTMNRGSNIYVKEINASGVKTRKFRMRDGVKLTVVVK